MSVQIIVAILIIIALTWLAVKFLAGLIRTISTTLLIILAIIIIIAVFSGNDPFSIGPTASAVTEQLHQNIQTTTGTVETTTQTINDTYQNIRHLINETSASFPKAKE